MLCRILEVSQSGYYAWIKRAPSARAKKNALYADRIQAIHRHSRSTYGRPRIDAELREDGICLGSKRLARLMRERRCYGASRRKSIVTTLRNRDARPAPDLVDRNFTADAPDKLWVADITYIPTWSGFLFLAVVMDVFSRADRRMGDGKPHAQRTRRRRARHGDLPAEAGVGRPSI
jgi:putative transposase